MRRISVEERQENFLRSYLHKFWRNIDLEKQLKDSVRKDIEDLDNLISDLGKEKLRDLVALMFFYGSGLSVSEICSLDRDDIESIKGMNMIKVHEEENKSHYLPLNMEIHNALTQYLKTRKDNEPALLLSSKHKRFTEDELQKLVKNYPDKALYSSLEPLPGKVEDYVILPTPLRLNANPQYTGRGVTIAFIDSGFYPHPDLTKPHNRILAFVDITDPDNSLANFEKPGVWSWHGMQTSVSAAGNGYLSGGLYKGIAFESYVVLVKVGGPHGIYTNDIIKAFEWVIKNKDRYNIRILNVSLGGGDMVSYRDSKIDQVAEEAVQAGIAVVVAAGNEGWDAEHPVTPPGNAPSVITVGGLDDQNSLSKSAYRMYHSSYGPTIDGLQKPEIIAPGIWVAAPILPGSPLYDEAEILYRLCKLPDDELKDAVKENIDNIQLPTAIVEKPIPVIKSAIMNRIKECKIIEAHYQHVDGTSFSAPIVASIIAQMIEADPKLTPKRIKEILIKTADKIPGIPQEMQGYGVVNPRDAVDGALRGGIAPTKPTGLVSPFVRRDNRVSFYYRNDNAKTVAVAGDFNNWDKTKDMMVRDEDRIWNIEIYFPLPGTYRYKFVIDDNIWIPDPNNDRQENDGYMGMNSVFTVETLGEAGEILNEVEEWLSYNTPESGNQFIRKEAIVRLGRLLDLSSSPNSTEIREYYIRRMEDTIRKLEKHTHHKKATIWQLYNDGYIIQVPQKDENLKLNIGFDVVSGRHVWGVQWDIPDNIVESIADSIDVLFISHRHPDHLDLDIANRMIKAGKVVIVPNAIIDLFRTGAIGISPDEVKEITDTEGKTINLTVKANLGDHVYDKGRRIDLLYYEVTVEAQMLNKDKKELKIVHTSDHDYTKSFKASEDIDILFAKCGDINPNYSPSQAMEILLARCNPKLVIPAHLEEIGHPIAGGRESYESFYKLINKCSMPVVILTWGESVNYPPDFSSVDTTQPKELAIGQKSTKF